MNAVPSLSRGVQLGLLESELVAGGLTRQAFLARARALGVSSDAAGEDADRFVAIAANQAQPPSEGAAAI